MGQGNFTLVLNGFITDRCYGFQVYGILHATVALIYASFGLCVLYKQCPLRMKDLKEPGHLSLASNPNRSVVDTQTLSEVTTADNISDKVERSDPEA
ncbi:hypothetical protein D918_03510 [Trichuris suis]|nr:hypothetical protein D918_03510 [Trichuris suis]